MKDNTFDFIDTEKEVKVSIIIPIHNSERYLKECMDSALAQTLKEIEFLCIDGGSTDLSFDIIKEIQQKDDRVIYITDPNTGYGRKINIGIKRAKGKYIAILETDDRMTPNMIKSLYDIACQYEVDIVDADYNKFFYYRDREYRERVVKYNNSQNYNHLIEYTDSMDKDIASHGIWTALYKKEFLERNNIYLNESKGASYQDTSFLFLSSYLAKSVYHLDLPLYEYRVDNMESSVNDNKKIFEIIGECKYLQDNLKKRNMMCGDMKRRYYEKKYNAFFWNYCRLSSGARECFLKSYEEELIQDINSGNINRNVFRDYLYSRTFLLIDDKDKFINLAIKESRKSWRDEFCDVLDKIKKRDIIVFGCGQLGTRFIEMLQQYDNNLRGICDNSKELQGVDKYGFTVCSVEEVTAKFRDVLYVIIIREYGDEMKQQLTRRGIKEENIIILGDE